MTKKPTSVLYARVPTDIHDALHRISRASGLTLAETTARVLALGLGIDLDRSRFSAAVDAERDRAVA
jgi:hypothetical protein